MSSDGWLSPGTCGVQLGMFDQLTRLMTQAGPDLEALAQRLYSMLATAGADPAPALEIRRIARWATAAAPDLKRRNQLAHDLDAQHLSITTCVPDGAFLTLPDHLTDQQSEATGRQAADLLIRAMSGDRGALYTLLDYREHAADPSFARTLLTRLGPAGLLDAPFKLSALLRADANDHSKMLKAHTADTRAALDLLSHALSTATDPRSPAYLGDAYLTSLTTTGRSGFPTGTTHPHHVGYQGLATILTGTAKYSDAFMRTVGKDMIAFTRHTESATWRPIPDATSIYFPSHPTDILEPLLTTASATPTGAQILLEHPLNEPTGNLHYLLHDRRTAWSATDKGTALGKTIRSAAAGDDPISTQLFEEFVRLHGTDTLTHIKYKEGHTLKITPTPLNALSGLRSATASLLTTHLDDITNQIDVASASSDEGYERMRHFLALYADASLDDRAFDRLLKAHVEALHLAVEDYARTGHDGYVISYADALGRLFALRTEMAAALGDDVRASNDDLKKWIDMGVGWVSPAGYLEKFGIPPEAASVVEGGMQTRVSDFLFGQVADHSQDKNTEQERTRQAVLLNRMVDRMLITAYVKELEYDPSMEGQSFAENGEIRSPPWSDLQLMDFGRWSRDHQDRYIELNQLTGATINGSPHKAIDAFATGDPK